MDDIKAKDEQKNAQDDVAPKVLPEGERRTISDHIAYFDSLVDAKPVEVPLGKCRCSNLDGVMLVTTVGTGIGICMHDSKIKAGGLGHLLLPEFLLDQFPHFDEQYEPIRYQGELLMSTMVTTLTQLGGRPSNIRVKLFGGGLVRDDKDDLGHKIYIFVKEYLVRNGLQVVSEDIGKPMGRRIQYLPVSGRGMRRYLKRQSDFEQLGDIENQYEGRFMPDGRAV